MRCKLRFMIFPYATIFSIIVLATTAMGLPGSLHATTFKFSQQDDTSSLLHQVSLNRCTRLSSQNGREHLINRCNSCRIVSVQRKRPGADAPISRTLTVPRKSNVTLSFRGPGHSRITSDAPCKPEANTQSRSPNTVQNDTKKCIQLNRSANGLTLTNICSRCRTGVIERLDTKGGKRMQNIALDARKSMGLPAEGAAYARVLTEKNCN